MIRLFEFFAGIGTQYQACKDVFGKDNVCSVGISEIDPVHSKLTKLSMENIKTLAILLKLRMFRPQIFGLTLFLVLTYQSRVNKKG